MLKTLFYIVLCYIVFTIIDNVKNKNNNDKENNISNN